MSFGTRSFLSNCSLNSLPTFLKAAFKVGFKVGFKVALLILPIGVATSAVEKSAYTEMKSPCTFFPPNKLRFPIRNSGHMPEQTFRRIVQVIGDIYAPLFRKAGHPPLYISPRWTDDTVNAFALICNEPEMLGKSGYPPECGKMKTSAGVITPFSLVVMFGGLARHPQMTPEGFVLVACHEIGHHLGGFPRYEKNTAWAAVEGQSDYFATAKCARKVFQAVGDSQNWAQKAQVDFGIRRTCQASFPNSQEEAAICMRSAMGGLTLARVLNSLGDNPTPVTFGTPDRNVVTETFEGHPAAQCRLDTYLAGSVCRISADEDFSPKEARTGSCDPSRIERVGSRPLCWFNNGRPALRQQ